MSGSEIGCKIKTFLLNREQTGRISRQLWTGYVRHERLRGDTTMNLREIWALTKSYDVAAQTRFSVTECNSLSLSLSIRYFLRLYYANPSISIYINYFKLNFSCLLTLCMYTHTYYKMGIYQKCEYYFWQFGFLFFIWTLYNAISIICSNASLKRSKRCRCFFRFRCLYEQNNLFFKFDKIYINLKWYNTFYEIYIICIVLKPIFSKVS